MDKIDKIDEELSKNTLDVFTPDTLAWHLLVSDEVKNIDVGQLMASIDLDEEPNPKIYNREAYEFEILLTIYITPLTSVMLDGIVITPVRLVD